LISLREEIANIIAENDDPINFNSDDMYYFMGDEIIKLFEKRIDSIQDQLKKDYDDDLVVYGINESFNKVKEMLK